MTHYFHQTLTSQAIGVTRPYKMSLWTFSGIPYPVTTLAMYISQEFLGPLLDLGFRPLASPLEPGSHLPSYLRVLPGGGPRQAFCSNTSLGSGVSHQAGTLHRLTCHFSQV